MPEGGPLQPVSSSLIRPSRRQVLAELLDGSYSSHGVLSGFVLLLIMLGLLITISRSNQVALADAPATEPVYAQVVRPQGGILPSVAARIRAAAAKPAAVPHPVHLLDGKIVGGWLINGTEQDNGYLTGRFYPINTLSPFWYEMAADGISISQKGSAGPIQQVTSLAQSSHIQLLPAVSGDPNIISVTLHDAGKRSQHIQALMALVDSQHFDGIDIDYEQLQSDDAPYYNAFITALADALHKDHKLLSVALEARIGNTVALDWPTIGQAVDRAEVMVYDYHSKNTGHPGPIGPVGWLNDVVAYAKKTLGAKKTVLAVGTYGYDWVPSADGGNYQGSGLTFADVQALLAEQKATVKRASGADDRGFDVGTVPNFTYPDASGVTHSVWFEDVDSILQKVPATKDLAGIYFWRLASEDQSVWSKLKEL